VSIGVKQAVRSPETFADSAGQIETESLRDLGSKYAEWRLRYPRSQRLLLRSHQSEVLRVSRRFRPRQNSRNQRKFQLLHALPATERRVLVPGNTSEERFGDACCVGCRTDACQFFTVRDHPGSIKSHPLAGVRARFSGEPLQLFAPLVHGPCRFPSQSCRLLFNRQTDALVLRQNKRLKRAQDPLFVNSFALACHTAFIVPIGAQRLIPGASWACGCKRLASLLRHSGFMRQAKPPSPSKQTLSHAKCPNSRGRRA
jgi:hypothetical protein